MLLSLIYFGMSKICSNFCSKIEHKNCLIFFSWENIEFLALNPLWPVVSAAALTTLRQYHECQILLTKTALCRIPQITFALSLLFMTKVLLAATISCKPRRVVLDLRDIPIQVFRPDNLEWGRNSNHMEDTEIMETIIRCKTIRWDTECHKFRTRNLLPTFQRHPNFRSIRVQNPASQLPVALRQSEHSWRLLQQLLQQPPPPQHKPLLLILMLNTTQTHQLAQISKTKWCSTCRRCSSTCSFTIRKC